MVIFDLIYLCIVWFYLFPFNIVDCVDINLIIGGSKPEKKVYTF